MKRLLVLFPLILVSISSFAQKNVLVDAEYTYVVPENTTVEQAKLTALDRAKIQAIADEFGTIVSQSNTTFIDSRNGESSILFQSLGGSQVKGEWIETIGEPTYLISYEQNMLIVNVKVKGRIRELYKSQVDLLVQILCNGTTPQFERSEFKDGDNLFLRVLSPVDGYLAVYLVDYSEQTAFCILPYSQSPDTAQKVVHDKSYLFFSIENAPIDIRNEVDEYTLTCSGDKERNDIYVVFSPNEFVKANSKKTSELIPKELSLKDFSDWLVNIRIKDNKIQIINKSLTIKK